MTNLHEEWRPVSGYEKFYEVSSLGRVRRVGGRILKPYTMRGGYQQVTLCINSRSRKKAVHRLVAKAFVPGSGRVVRHLNHDPADNRPMNLSWGSHADNTADSIRDGRFPVGADKRQSILSNKDVLYIRADKATSHIGLAAKYGVSTATIENIRHGRSWRHLLPADWKPRDYRSRGSQHPRTRLADDAVRAIRADPRSMREIAAAYGVSKATVHRIKRRISWKHVA